MSILACSIFTKDIRKTQYVVEKEQLPLLKVMEGHSFTSTRGGGVLCLKNKGIGWRNPSSEYGMEVGLFSKHYKIKDGGFSIKR